LSSEPSLYTALEQIGRLVYEISRKVDRIEDFTREMADRVDRLEKEVGSLSSRVSGLESAIGSLAKELGDIKESISYLENELEKARRELGDRIAKVESRVEKVEGRIDEVEKNLDQHLARQDVVLQRNSEALLNSLAMQFVVNVVSKVASSAHVVLCHLNEKPLIVIEFGNDIYVTLISVEVLKEDLRTLENLSKVLKEYSDKEVKYSILATGVSEAEAPVWLYSLP